MIIFFQKLFDTSDFPARWDCGNWDQFHGWLHIGADIAIWAAYFVIPVALGYYWWSKRSDLVFPRLLWLFAAFVFSCGTAHLIEATIFYVPIYRISGLMKFITAVVSWMTVIAILRVGRQALDLPGLASLSRDLQQQLDRARLAENQLEESNHELLEYTSRVTHDLRNPLSGILLLGDLALESSKNGKSALASEQLVSMLDSLREMDISMQELHRHSLVETKQRELQMVALEEVLETVTVTLAPLISETGATLRIGSLPAVMGNRTLLAHLFMNLIDNAIKYRGSEALEIEVTASGDSTYEIVQVVDNGRGIPEAERETIFDAEHRGSNVQDQPGSGVGLSLCRSIMKSHKGTVRVISGEKRGTVFELRFPRLGVSEHN